MLNEYGRKDPLLLACRSPETLTKLSETAWQDLLLRARQSGLLPRLYSLLEERELLKQIPEKARLQLTNARMFVERNQTDIRFEVNRVVRALSSLGRPIILLKGAAYLLADLPPGRRRFATDLDILVPKEHLDLVERTLLAEGWQRKDITDYDDRYYREWMHEIPALGHPDRLFAVDVHHTILPTTSRYKPDTKALFASAIQLDDRSLKVLCPADMVLHCAVHFLAEEFTSGLRDLADLHDLLEYFGKTDEFWDQLIIRSSLHGLDRILYYLLRYVRHVFGTNIPNSVEMASQRHAPHMIVRTIMDLLVMSALKPLIPGQSRPGQRIALWFLLIRSHWLKMPPFLLAQHLFVKALHRWRTWFKSTSATAETEPN